MAVILDRHAAAGGSHHDCFGTRLHQRPPGVDIAPHVIQAAGLIVQMEANRTTATGFRRHHQLHTERIEHARGGGVDIGRHRRLHAAVEQQHFARMDSSRPETGWM